MKTLQIVTQCCVLCAHKRAQHNMAFTIEVSVLYSFQPYGRCIMLCPSLTCHGGLVAYLVFDGLAFH